MSSAPEHDSAHATERPAASDDPLRLDRQLCFALAATSRTVIGVYRPVLEPLGLTHPQYLVMLALWERSPRRLVDIGDALLLDPATLSPLVRRLEQAGLVTRERDVRDGRAIAIRLTSDGERMRAQAESVPGQIVERLGMPIAELERIRDALTGLLDAARPATDLTADDAAVATTPAP